MDLKVVELTGEVGVFDVKGATPSFLNAIRRTLLSQVPKLAIEDVTVYDNTSALFDEMIAHRLGLLPVPTDLNAFNRRWKDNNASPKEGACPTCNGEGCASCTVLFTLSKEGPGTVYSGDLTPTDPKYRVKDERIPIVKLLEGQRLMLEAAAILGTGKKHAKWMPVQAAGFREVPHVRVTPATIPPELASRIRETAPPNSVRVEDGKLLVLDEERAYTYLRGLMEVAKVPGVELATDRDRFLFHFETDGSLTAKEALLTAVHQTMDKLKAVEEGAAKLKEEVVA
jgi:DNA-directed RNA polymerase subunit D